MKRLALFLAAACVSLNAQSGPTFTKVYSVSPSGAAAVSSLQQPSDPTKTVVLLGVSVYCSVACTADLEAAGAATGSSTNGTRTAPGDLTVSTALHFAASNASAPSEPISTVVIAAGTDKQPDCTIGRIDGKSNCYLTRKAGLNFTIRTSSITGDVKITWLWREE
jgi:hypothetical protein